ncbi:MAG: carboxypeptidase regulatory-like domain-containing protein, partial [Candidatus Brocadiae bacterium]|nr:carboxypeptidase regulatory-like domain-containing protein [Candidatus Brocadiia bacterium]
PAGAIVGRVLDKNGVPVIRAWVTAVVLKWPPRVRGLSGSQYGGADEQGRFSIGALPLGGEDLVVAHEENRVVASAPIVLDEVNPTAEIELRLLAGEALQGQLLGLDGKPVEGARVTLTYDTDHGWSSSAAFVLTGPQGWFVFEGFNPDVPGHYELAIKPLRDYRPIYVGKIRTDGEPLLYKLARGMTARGVVVEDSSGHPIPGADVQAEALRPPRGGISRFAAEGRTNERGEFRFSNLAPGRYRILFHAGSVPETIIQAGREEPVEVRVKLAEWSSLSPRKPE